MKLPIAPSNVQTWVYDCEVFSNFFLAIFNDGEEERLFTHENLNELVAFVNNPNIVLAGFNNFGYDDVIIKQIVNNALLGKTIACADIKELSDAIIGDDPKFKDILFGWTWETPPWAYSIDLYMLLNKKLGLKELECKLGFNTVEEYHGDFNKPLDPSHVTDVIKYCRNDVEATKYSLLKNWDKVTLRESLLHDYGLMDKIWCMPEQGVAQHVFLTLHRERTGNTSAKVREASRKNPDNRKTEWSMPELTSDRVVYRSDQFKEFFDRWNSGRVIAANPQLTSWKLEYDRKSTENLAGKDFAIGVGGIHTVDPPGHFASNENNLIVDLDVASYYPSLIIELGLYPKQLGPSFCEDMRLLTERRIMAKNRGDKKTSEALKVVINSTFGKLNDAYSPLRSIPDAMRVTLNGQLMILMLVEALYSAGFQIISANTDGVTILAERDKIAALMDGIVTQWQTTTHMKLERVDYVSLTRRDVNSYIAITTDGKVKYKGVVNKDAGKSDGLIVKHAVDQYFERGIAPEVTVAACQDIRQFLYYMRSKNGGTLYHRVNNRDEVIGKTARWLVSNNPDQLIVRHNPATACRKASIAAIPNSTGAALVMDIERSGNLSAVNHSHYVEESWKLIIKMNPTIQRLQSLPIQRGQDSHQMQSSDLSEVMF